MRGFSSTHNETASTLSLAQTLLGSLDKTKAETSVSTLSLELILLTLIRLGSRGGDVRQTIQEQEVKIKLDAVRKTSEEVQRKMAAERDAEESRIERGM